MYSYENKNIFDEKVKDNISCSPLNHCKYFNSSANVYQWVLDTANTYYDSRYGGISVNDSKIAVWYNNKGYHAMPVYLNKLNTALFNAELGTDEYNITTFNHPLQLGRDALSTSNL